MQDIGNGSESRVFTKLMAGEGTVILYEAFGPHIFKGGLLHDDKHDLSKLGGKKQAIGVIESIFGCPDVDIRE